ncbi:MAG: DUF502 domain-containing protein [Pirellulales bacterium]|nr:DUF502 domain-containing protein [Pirellulales bacterium]
MASGSAAKSKDKAIHPFRRAVIRGLGVLLPPLLTIVIFLWVAKTIKSYVLDPVVGITHAAVRMSVEEIKTESELTPAERANFVQTGDGKYVPQYVYATVKNHPRRDPTLWQFERRQGTESLIEVKPTADQIYDAYVTLTYLQPWVVIPVFLAAFLLVLYLLGKFLAAGAGRVGWNVLEGGIHRLPLIRNVYGSVKQVTDFVFSETEIEFNRVVAVEYPRKGMFSLGLVTGDSLLDLEAAANEPVVSVLMPTSPMPMTGFTCTFRKSETVDLNITIDQAIQYVVSCGVVVPPQQMRGLTKAKYDQKVGNGQPALPEPAAASEGATVEEGSK